MIQFKILLVKTYISNECQNYCKEEKIFEHLHLERIRKKDDFLVSRRDFQVWIMDCFST